MDGDHDADGGKDVDMTEAANLINRPEMQSGVLAVSSQGDASGKPNVETKPEVLFALQNGLQNGDTHPSSKLQLPTGVQMTQQRDDVKRDANTVVKPEVQFEMQGISWQGDLNGFANAASKPEALVDLQNAQQHEDMNTGSETRGVQEELAGGNT
jgi:hypothetical protein